jgi:ABC-type antimicrobial peptide transport system permease subunit
MDAMVGDSMDMQRFRSILVSLFAAIGLLLAVLGVYGTVAYTVAQRTFEIGLRMTFGAARQSILKMILRQALVEVAVGIGIGLVLSLVASRWIASMLVGVSATDPVSLAAAAALLLVTATAAALLPARKAASVEPMLTLREM